MAEITAELNLKIAGLQAGLERARGEMAAFKKYAQSQGQGIGAEFMAGMRGKLGGLLGGLGAPLTLGAGVLGLKNMAESFDRIGDTAAALDSSVEGVQRLQYIAAGTVTPFDQMASGLMRIKRALIEVDNEAKQKALESIGLNARQFIGMDADKAFIQLSRAYQQSQASGKGFAEVMQLIKGASPDLFGAISTNTDALLAMTQQSVVSQATMDQYVSSLAKVKQAQIAMTNTVVLSAENWRHFIGAVADGITTFSGGIGFMQGYEGYIEAQGKALAEQGRLEEAAADARKKRTAAELDQIEALKKAKADEKAARDAAVQVKAAEGVHDEETKTKIAELRGSGRGMAANKLEKAQKEREEFHRLRDAHPERGDEWAKDQAHRRAAAEQMVPGRIRGYKHGDPHAGSKPGEGLDWLYGHNRDKGGQPMNKEFKFPTLESIDRKMSELIRAVE